MKTREKKEITRNRVKSSPLKPAFLNCNDINTLVSVGRFQSLCVAEGYYLLGLERGYWNSREKMFQAFRSIGLRYSRCSFARFRSGQYQYIPSFFLSALAAALDVSFPVAYSAGYNAALVSVSRHPERWVIPSYVQPLAA